MSLIIYAIQVLNFADIVARLLRDEKAIVAILFELDPDRIIMASKIPELG